MSNNLYQNSKFKVQNCEDDLDRMIEEYQFPCSQEYIEFLGGGTCINQCTMCVVR